jgi:hypothetical protein
VALGKKVKTKHILGINRETKDKIWYFRLSEGGADRLSRNVSNKPPIYAAYSSMESKISRVQWRNPEITQKQILFPAYFYVSFTVLEATNISEWVRIVILWLHFTFYCHFLTNSFGFNITECFWYIQSVQPLMELWRDYHQ